MGAAGFWTTLVGEETVEPVSTRKTVEPALKTVAGLLVHPGKEEPWLGVRLAKPATALYAQLPKVPKGTGFVVQEMPSNSPAEQAGVKRYDFLWKMDDQLLINEAQFLALLELQKVGDTVRLTIFRGGENIQLEAVLRNRPESEKGRDLADERVLSPPIPGLPRMEVVLPYRTAELRHGNETVRIFREKDVYQWTVFDDFGLEIDSGRIPVGDEIEVPSGMGKPLQAKLKALIRSYEEAERRKIRQPRVRRVPTSISGKSQ